MCGVAGVMAVREGAAPERASLRRVRDHMRARGPDGAGEWWSEDGRVGLAHRRLAIIDLSERGLQPMLDGPLAISFNGEIYNYRTLRAELEADGERFSSDSDTEVLLKLYRRKGTAMFHRLRGMYAFALWDAERSEILLARDPLGVKPLYYAEQDGSVWFASQARALADTGAVSAEPDLRAWTQFLLWGSIPEPRTAYAAIKSLPAGSWARVRAGRGVTVPVAYFDLARAYASDARPLPPQEAAAALRDSVAHHLVADVPVGIFLSSGIDSGALLGLARDAGASPPTLTLGFEEFVGSSRDEVPLAVTLARHYGVQHQVRRVSRSEFEQDLPKILAAMDQPSIDGVNTWFVSKAARELGWKVALSGLGGDELFGGYPSFRDVPRWVGGLSWVRHLPRTSEWIGRIFARFAPHPKAQGMLRYGGAWAGAYFLRRGLFMPWEVESERPSWIPADPDAVSESLRILDNLLDPNPGSDHARVAILESGAYMRNQLLRDSDWASMAHSLELRVPLVDAQLIRGLGGRAAPKAGASPKCLLSMAPTRALPEVILRRPKTGFETPLGDWIRPPGSPQTGAWARDWARRILKARPGTAAVHATAPRRRLRVTQLQRKAISGYYSVERVFEDVRLSLMSDTSLLLRLRVNDYPSHGVLPRFVDAWRAIRFQSDVTHITGDVHYLAWWTRPSRTILTVLDCVSLHRLQGLRRAVFKWLWYTIPVRRASTITVISEFTRRELVAETGCDPEKIVVIYPHLSDEFVRMDRPFRTTRQRILQIGTKPNKNVGRLMAALSGLEVVLVVVGELSAVQRDLIDQYGLEVVNKVNLSRDELMNEYRDADLIAFVSTYEGFGLPIIEAQAVGRAVVTGNTCSMPEVAGEGGVVVDPENLSAIRAAFVRLIEDREHREAVIEAGFRNVERFRLPVIAAQYSALYHRVSRMAACA